MIDAVSLMAFLNEAEKIILKHSERDNSEYAKGVFRGVDHVRQYVEDLIDIKEHEAE
jgi:dihydrodipicolinate reductase